MTWENLHNKFKHLHQMKVFRLWCFKNGFEDGGNLIKFRKSNIKAMFGYLQCYASTKGISLFIGEIQSISGGNIVGQRAYTHYWTGFIKEQTTGNWIEPKIDEYSDNYKKPEQAMIWCIEEYFTMEK